MKAETPLVRYLTLVFLCLLAAAVLVVFPVFLSRELDNQSRDFLQEISEKNGEAVGFKFREQASYLTDLISEVDTDLLDNPAEAVKEIDLINTGVKYKRYGIITSDATAYTSDGIVAQVVNKELVAKCFESRKLTVSTLSADESLDGDEVFIMMRPIYKNNQINHVMYVVFTIEQITENFKSDAFNSNEFFYIVDIDGNNIFSTNKREGYRNIDNVFSENMQEEKYKGERIPQIREDMKNGESGVTFSSKNSDFYLYYAPLHFNDWYLFSVVPASEVTARRNTVLAYVILMCIFLVGVFCLFALYIVSSERRKKNELDKLLYTDSLTGGPSYAKFCLDVKKQLAKGYKKAAYIVMDIDNFKLINSYYSYEHGNKTINYIYSVWRDMLRENEFVGRIAADRFAVYLKYSDENELKQRIDDFCKNCRTYDNEGMTNYILTPSIGIYYINPDDKNIQQIQNCAVIAKSLVKGDSDHLYSVYNDKLKNRLTNRKILADKLAQAIENESLSVMFQPQFNASDRKICGAEALLRWQDENGNSISPADFVPLAEACGLIVELDKFVFRKACEAQRKMADAGLSEIDISINVSQQSLYNASFVDDYVSIVKNTNADISHIQLEITESTLFDNNKVFVKLLRKLHKAGFKILMDDFGTGYSSMMLLKSMPIDYLKLDKSFIDDYDSMRGGIIIECIMSMAKKLGMVLISEGVETEEQFSYISNMGCDIVQGYYFCRPVSFDELCKMIENS